MEIKIWTNSTQVSRKGSRIQETDTGKVFYDADGSGVGVSILIATLTGAPTLTIADILVT